MRLLRLGTALIALALSAPAPARADQPVAAHPPALAALAPEPPSVEFGALYRAVEMGSVFPDQKTFADAVPKAAPPTILGDYEKHKDEPGFDLKSFVDAHFSLPQRPSVEARAARHEGVAAYVSSAWNLLQRQPVEPEPYSSLLPLARPYIVPGGRFSEIYYWDTFFTMLGLEQDNRHDVALDMLKNEAALIDRYGHVPNGNRSYYLSRSQPPFFSDMVELIARHDGDRVDVTYLPEMQAEYDFWMDGADRLTPGDAHRRLVRLADGTLLNRYWDDRDVPRDESFRQDVETAGRARRPAAEVFRDLRAAAESGWDFSSRWLATEGDLASIRTSAVAPVDLNSLMVHMERMLAKAYRLKGDEAAAARFDERAQNRIEAVRRLMWDAEAGAFTDYLWREGRQTHVLSAAALYPLFFGVATPDQAHASAATVRQKLLRPGGIATTLDQTGQQWDRPNGWAPLQYLAIEGLKAYGEQELAQEIATRWMARNIEGFERSGALVEKYDVEDVTARPGGGGEYDVQVGFGWTNGVLVVLMHDYPEAASRALAAHPAPKAP
jgi:alpha,alpha-trehalase